MNEQSIRLTPLAAAIAAVLYPVHPAFAQDRDADNPVLEEVIVTATMREANIQTVPQSITAFSTVEIQRANLQTLEDAVRALPSLNLTNSQPGRNELVYRGVSSGTGEYYTDTQTAVYLDDSSISLISQQPFPHFVDIEMLESLPGPQGTLYGSASQTGTLRYITHKPNMAGLSGEVFGELGTTKGGDASYQVSGWVNIPVTEGLALRAVGYYVKEGGWIDNVPGRTYADPKPDGPQFDPTNQAVVENNQNKRRLTGGRISALWELTDDLSVLLSVISEDSHDDGTWSSDPALGDNKIIRFFDEYRDDRWTNVAFNIDADLGLVRMGPDGLPPVRRWILALHLQRIRLQHPVRRGVHLRNHLQRPEPETIFSGIPPHLAKRQQVPVDARRLLRRPARRLVLRRQQPATDGNGQLALCAVLGLLLQLLRLPGPVPDGPHYRQLLGNPGPRHRADRPVRRSDLRHHRQVADHRRHALVPLRPVQLP
jgi:outer membrane receptor protein involved in Fe transport